MRTLSLVALVVLVSLSMSMTLGVQEQDGYFAKLLDLHDLNNHGPKAEAQVLKYEDFVETGEICGVKLGISMTQAVEVWGKPKSIGYTGNGNYWSLRYGRGSSLEFSEDRLVSISLAAENMAGSTFDNGIRTDMTRSEIIAVLGEPFNSSHAGISYKVGGERIVDFNFQIAGRFPKNDSEWNSAKLWCVSINGTEWVRNGM